MRRVIACVACALVLFNTACRTLQPLPTGSIRGGEWVRVEAPGGFDLVGGTPAEPMRMVTCRARSVEGRLSAIEGDTLVLFEIARLRLAEGADARCRSMTRGSIALPAAGAVVSAARRNPSLTTAVLFAVVMFVLYAAKKISEECCYDD